MKRYFKYSLQAIAFFLPSFLKITLWRCAGFKIGERVKIGMFSLIMVDDLELEDDVRIDSLTMIVFLKQFRLGQRSRIAYFSIIYGTGAFYAESCCLVSVQCLIECSPYCSVTMKHYSCFGPRNTIYTHGIFLPMLRGFPSQKGDVFIDTYSWTGMSTTILPNTFIGKNTIIAPGAVLSGQVPDNAFIKPLACQYESSPVSQKMRQHSRHEIHCYIKNVITAIANDDERIFRLKPAELFRDLSIPPAREYMGKSLFLLTGESESIKRPDNAIVIGYGLPERIRKDKGLLWLDFEDFTASHEPDRTVCQLIERLYYGFGIIFLFSRD